MKLRWAAASDAGQVRANNQDAAVAEDGLFAVADGMGGHAAGEVASQVAVEALRASIGSGIVEAVRVANRAVWERAGADPALRGMGTTVCALALVDDGDAQRIHVVNVGDSRGYLFRDGELEQVTDDHSLPADLVREGRLTPEEARIHPQRNILTRVLGNDPDVVIDEFSIDPFRGDRYLLCSDGLFNEVSDQEIAAALRAEPDPQVVADELVRKANAGGGRDNITVVVVDVLDDDDKARSASAALAGSAATSVAQPLAAPSQAEARRTRPATAVRGERARRSRFTWRTALFTLAVLAILGVVVGSVWWIGRNTYYVGFDGDEVTIFRGRPGGVLWLDPTVEQHTGITRDDVAAARLDDLDKGKDEATLTDARRYVRSVTTTTTTTTSTTTTTTTIATLAPTTTTP